MRAAVTLAAAAMAGSAPAPVITAVMVGTEAAMAGTEAVMVGEAAMAGGAVMVGMGRGAGAVSGWVCMWRLCLCITRPFGGTAFPTTMQTTRTIVGTVRSTNTRP